jgi:hypothetical protein
LLLRDRLLDFRLNGIRSKPRIGGFRDRTSDHQIVGAGPTALRDAGVTFQVGFHRRFDPDWVAVVGRIRAGELDTDSPEIKDFRQR